MGIADRKAREFERRGQDILSVALSLVGSGDWQSVTMDDIAEKAEIGKGTIYKHFKSKDEVCARLEMEHAKPLLDELQRIDPHLGLIPRFRAFIKLMWRHQMENRELQGISQYCEIRASALKLSADFAEEYKAVKEAIEGMAFSLIREGVEKGIFSGRRKEYLGLSVWGAIIGTGRLLWNGNYPDIDQEAYLDYLCDFILKGFMNADGSAYPRN
ncbi:MAG: TetR/AcrR family transcriptional regulator [SAR324 cluster bacterium]|nr:TetR/AcrR family transcriptional regulator [SAR324 cluster bacterium]